MSAGKRKSHPPLRIFVSHSADDAAFVRKLRNLLAHRTDARVFSADDLTPGSNWRTQLRNELAHADVVIAVLTPGALDSEWVQHEIGAAWVLQKPVLSIVTEADLLKKVPVRSVQVFRIEDLEQPKGMDDFVRAFESVPATSQV
jgi:nucleoside 2-deoxyribosyltransferase